MTHDCACGDLFACLQSGEYLAACEPTEALITHSLILPNFDMFPVAGAAEKSGGGGQHC